MSARWLLENIAALALLLCILHLFAGVAAAKGATVRPHRPVAVTRAGERVRALYDRLPLAFEPNRGQADPRATFLTHAQSYALFLTDRGAFFSPFACATPSKDAPCWVRMEMLGANSAPEIRGIRQLPGRVNYFIGQDPHHWRTGIPLFASVAYAGVYPGIDLVYYGNPQQLEYDFTVGPHADPGHVRLQFEGPYGPLALRVSRSGDLEATTGGATLRFLKPVAFQLAARGERRAIDCQYALNGSGRVSLSLGAYDRSKPLVIDPALVYSTYLGGNGGDSATAIAVDGSGDAFVTGSTGSTNFPTQTPEQKAIAGTANAFVSELKPDGSGLVYSTYVGGSGFDKGTGIALDSSGNAYVTGYTTSPDFPGTKGFYQATYNGAGKDEAFVFELNSGGAAFGYSTYLGGSGGDFAYGIALDSSKNAYVTGSTQSSDFPCTNKLLQNTSLGASEDAFVFKLDPTGKTAVYGTCLGGSQSDVANAIALDSAGEATVAGFTLSPDFPTQKSIQGYGGAGDAFVARLNASGSGLVFSTFLGGSGEDRGLGVAVDGNADTFVTGSTQSPSFLVPSPGGAFQPHPGGGADAFVTELNPTGNQILYLTFLGGNANDQGEGVAVDGAGNAYVVGSTSSANFPTLNSVEATLGEGACAPICSNAFITVIKPSGAALLYSTYLGGNGPDYGQAIAVDSSGNAYVAGITSSSLFPATGAAAQGTFGGSANLSSGFVAKITQGNGPAVAVNPQTINFGNVALAVASSRETVTLTNVSSAQVTLNGLTFSDPEFAQSGGSCAFPGTLATSGAQCTIGVTFTPSSSASTSAATTGTMQINDSVAGSPQSVALSGTGATPGPGITFSPSPLNIPGQVIVGNSAPPFPVTLTNSGTAPLSITKVTISGSYTETDKCVTTIQPGQSCTIQVTFSPTSTSGSSSTAGSTANNTGSITITSNITGTSPSLTINGTATADFALSSTGPSGVTLVSATSATLTVGASVVSGSPSFSGSISITCSSEVTCSSNPTSITPGQTTALTVTGFTGTSTNPVTFTLTGTSGTQSATLDASIPLQGFTLAAVPALTTIKAGETATYTVTVSSVNGFNFPVALSCSSGLPANASCSFSPSTVTPGPGAPQTSTLTITTTAHKGTSFAAPLFGPGRPPVRPGWKFDLRKPVWLIWLMVLAGLGMVLAARRRKPVWLAFGLLIAAALLFTGCNIGYYGFIGSNPAPTGSPSGVYTVTVAGTYTPASGTTGQAATSQSTTLNLAVQ